VVHFCTQLCGHFLMAFHFCAHNCVHFIWQFFLATTEASFGTNTPCCFSLPHICARGGMPGGFFTSRTSSSSIYSGWWKTTPRRKRAAMKMIVNNPNVFIYLFVEFRKSNITCLTQKLRSFSRLFILKKLSHPIRHLLWIGNKYIMMRPG